MTKSEATSSNRISTALTKLGRDPNEQCGFSNPPLYKGSTVIHKNVERLENLGGRFYYGTAGTPTIANLEDAWTRLTGAAGIVLSWSGLGSTALAVLSVINSGDHILVPKKSTTQRLCSANTSLQNSLCKLNTMTHCSVHRLRNRSSLTQVWYFLRVPNHKQRRCKISQKLSILRKTSY